MRSFFLDLIYLHNVYICSIYTQWSNKKKKKEFQKKPMEYPLSAGEEPLQLRRRIGTTFKLDDNLLPTEEDPALQELESNFIFIFFLV